MCQQLSTAVVRLVGQALLWMGLTGFVFVGLWEVIPALPHWLPLVQGLALSDYAPRFFLSVVTLVEVPIIEVTVIGLSMLAVAQSRTLATTRHVQHTQAATLNVTPQSIQRSRGP